MNIPHLAANFASASISALSANDYSRVGFCHEYHESFAHTVMNPPQSAASGCEAGNQPWQACAIGHRALGLSSKGRASLGQRPRRPPHFFPSHDMRGRA